MNYKLTYVFALILPLAIGACTGETTAANAESIDTAAEDSALALAVMTATPGAPLPDAVYEPPPLDGFTDVSVKQSTSRGTSPKAAARAPRPVTKKARPVAPRVVATSPVEREPQRVAIIPRDNPDPEPAEPREENTRTSAGVISSGSALSLITDNRVCDVDSRRTFSAVVARSVRGSNGAEIPQGAHAVAEITGTDKWGAGVSVRVKSVRVNGKSYPLTSGVEYVMPESGGCLRDRTRIEVRTKAPLRVAVN